MDRDHSSLIIILLEGILFVLGAELAPVSTGHSA